VSAGATAALVAAASPAAAAIMTTGSLSISGAGSKFDLSNDELLVGGTLSTVRGQIAAGQIWSSSGNAIGSLDVGGGLVEVRGTVLGDTNLDGKVDVTDLGNLASSYGTGSGAVWVQGDTNYDGKVDVTDLGNLASAYGADLSFGAAAQPAAVIAASQAVSDDETGAAPRLIAVNVHGGAAPTTNVPIAGERASASEADYVLAWATGKRAPAESKWRGLLL
jgi:hypothetical protein